MAPEPRIRHHPSEPTLLAHATGRLGLAAGLVVEAHLGVCPACRHSVAVMEALGGMLLDDLPPTPLAPGALERVVARLGEAPPKGQTHAAPTAHGHTGPITLPYPLHGLRVGRLRRIAPGLRHTLLLRAPGGSTLHLLWGKPGVSLPLHTHRGIELTYVIAGAFEDELGRFEAGDVEEADADLTHHQVVTGPADCMCLLATTGRLRFTGVLARLIQPLLPF
ncbi:MAG: cupin domain-containing protein [Acetobacteraceae bacterium]|nr:cupin domain-containing protein [Acetobacteraceae bacterium]